MKECPLDRAVEAALADLAGRSLDAPSVLFLLGTGTGMLPSRLERAGKLALSEVAGVPRSWQGLMLHHGHLAGATVWVLEDAPGLAELGNRLPAEDPPWVGGFPCWLAAAAGASVCVHSSAGAALPGDTPGGPEPGMLAFVSDHINVSGRTPLVGLAESSLGPLFPDQTLLHHLELRRGALALARRLGIPACETVAACTAGPTLETPAERRAWARAGAGVSVQELANPFHACAHAGLALLAVVAVSDRGEGMSDMAGIVARAEKLVPALEDLLVELAPELVRAASELGVEE